MGFLELAAAGKLGDGLKDSLRALLGSLGLLDTLRMVRTSSRYATLAGLSREVQYRLRGGPDGFPMPPAKLIYSVVGHGLADNYYAAGATIIEDMVEQLRQAGIDAAAPHRVLDFGCGCGRVLRHWHRRFPAAVLHGTDLNTEAIAWCRRSLPFAEFQTNHLSPPVGYPDGAFDLLYARSVLTHLSPSVQTAWLREWSRLLRPGGTLLCTTHGAACAPGTPTTQAAPSVSVAALGPEGSNQYGTYNEMGAMTATLAASEFRLLATIPGVAEMHREQDTFVAQRPA